MLKLIEGLPVNVLDVNAEGKITREDYENVLIPAIEEKLKVNKKINMLYHLGKTVNGISFGAMLDDAKIGIKKLSVWEKIAIVSDHEKINTMTKFFRHFIPCEIRIFKNAEIADATKWIIEK